MHPFTKMTPKCLLHLGYGDTVAERKVRILRKLDPNADIIYVLGFMHKEIRAVLPPDVQVIQNPFFLYLTALHPFGLHVIGWTRT